MHKLKMGWPASCVAVLCLSASTSFGQAALSESDQQFVEQAAHGGHAEVAMGETASKSENPAISAFGKQMIADHGKMNQELASIAKAKGIEPPSQPDLGSQAKDLATSILPGATFDSQYVSSQLDDHRETLALFEQEAQSGQDPELKAFAEQGIPVIQQHIAELEKLQQLPELQ